MVTIVGAGASGLFAAAELVRRGVGVRHFELTERSGTKLLVAGESGLNLTTVRDGPTMASRYGKDRDLFDFLLKKHSPEDFRSWLRGFGIETFVGSSGKVFPKEMHARDLREKLLAYLEGSGLWEWIPGHGFAGFTPQGEVLVNPTPTALPRPVILALGGASWPLTGSRGDWLSLFEKAGISTAPFRPMNCGFEVPWSPYFKALLMEQAAEKQTGTVPLKNCALAFQGLSTWGDLTLTGYGLEGSPVYGLSRELRDSLERGEKPLLQLDLFPDQDAETLDTKLNRPRGKMSGSTFLRKVLGLSKLEISLIAETHPGQGLSVLSGRELKDLRIPLLAPRPLEESISSSGGIKMTEITPEMELRSLPGVYCIGEMLDWDAPTGGYLLQGCFSTAMEAARACVPTP